jgi:hAT family C-terminal dimerisation region
VYTQLVLNELFRYMYAEWSTTENVSCELGFWKRHCEDMPILSLTSRVVFCVHVASSPLECDYGVASQIMSKLRVSLSAEFCEMLLIVSRELCRKQLGIKDVIELHSDERDRVIQQYIQQWRPMSEALIPPVEGDPEESVFDLIKRNLMKLWI